MPAEWEPHVATWLTWPHCEETWPGKLESVFPPYVAMIDALRLGETVHVNVLDEDARERVADLLDRMRCERVQVSIPEEAKPSRGHLQRLGVVELGQHAPHHAASCARRSRSSVTSLDVSEIAISGR